MCQLLYYCNYPVPVTVTQLVFVRVSGIGGFDEISRTFLDMSGIPIKWAFSDILHKNVWLK